MNNSETMSYEYSVSSSVTKKTSNDITNTTLLFVTMSKMHRHLLLIERRHFLSDKIASANSP